MVNSAVCDYNGGCGATSGGFTRDAGVNWSHVIFVGAAVLALSQPHMRLMPQEPQSQKLVFRLKYGSLLESVRRRPQPPMHLEKISRKRWTRLRDGG